jgi:hypothetical protein
MGYAVPEGLAGPPCPRGYKYSGLALQVGYWVTGQQSVTVKKSVLGNLNCGLKTVRLSRFNLGNVLTFYRAGAINKLVKEMDGYIYTLCKKLDGQGKEV